MVLFPNRVTPKVRTSTFELWENKIQSITGTKVKKHYAYYFTFSNKNVLENITACTNFYNTIHMSLCLPKMSYVETTLSTSEYDYSELRPFRW